MLEQGLIMPVSLEMDPDSDDELEMLAEMYDQGASGGDGNGGPQVTPVPPSPTENVLTGIVFTWSTCVGAVWRERDASDSSRARPVLALSNSLDAEKLSPASSPVMASTAMPC